MNTHFVWVRPFTLVALLLGCDVSQPTVPAPLVPPSEQQKPDPVAVTDFSSGPVKQVHSKRFDLRFSLADANHWDIDDQQQPWFVATHRLSSTTLLLRTWHQDDRANHTNCEQKARLWRDLPKQEQGHIIEQKKIDIPEGFDTILEIGISMTSSGSPIDGFALAFGGWAHKCFAYVLTTRAMGSEAERLVANRLATLVELSLLGLTLESELSPTIPR